MKELERETDHSFWALEATSGENPVSSDETGQVENMAKAWLAWGQRQGLI